jgi:glycosyltransferase involved in cell wall biosynthesis
MGKPIISVIITVFEQAQSLALLLRSLEAQDCGHSFEVIVCDDGSSSSVLKVCTKPLSPPHLDLKYMWQPDRGHRAARSRNNGIRCAQGQYLVFLDADIIVKSDFIRSHLEAHTQPRLMVCNPRRWVLESWGLIANKIGDELLPDIETLLMFLESCAVEVDRPYQRRDFISSTPSLAVVGFSFSVPSGPDIAFDEEFEGWGPEDRELALRLASLHGYSVKYHDEIEVFHLESCSTGRAPTITSTRGTMLPTEHQNIVSFFRNMIYFARQYPQADLSSLTKLLLHYRLDSATNLWRYQPIKLERAAYSTVERMTTEKKRLVETWLANESVYPLDIDESLRTK